MIEICHFQISRPLNDFNFQYENLRQLFRQALQENNYVNDGYFDWMKRLQEHRSNRQKVSNNNNTVIGRASNNLPTNSTNDITAKTIGNTYASASVSTPPTRLPTNAVESRQRSTTQRSNCHYQLPVSSGNMTTITLNGGSKTTLSMASTSKIPVTMIPSRSTANGNQKSESGPPPPTKRRGLVPPPVQMRPSSTQSNHQPISSPNLNNSNNTHLQKEPVSLLLGQPSEPTCCFFKRKAKRALQISSSTSRKT